MRPAASDAYIGLADPVYEEAHLAVTNLRKGILVCIQARCIDGPLIQRFHLLTTLPSLFEKNAECTKFSLVSDMDPCTFCVRVLG